MIDPVLDPYGPDPVPDEQFRAILDRGVPAPLSVYRRAYATVGVPWPGDDETRRRHLVNDDLPETPSSVGSCSAAQPLTATSR
jgi:hypothetical protein